MAAPSSCPPPRCFGVSARLPSEGGEDNDCTPTSADTGVHTEVLVHCYADRPLVLVSQTGGVGSWLDVRAEERPRGLERLRFDEDGEMVETAKNDDGLDIHVRFVLGRRDDMECAALELMAKDMMRAAVEGSRRGGDGQTGGVLGDGVTGGATGQCHSLMVSAGLQNYELANVKAIVKLFASAVKENPIMSVAIPTS